MVVIVALKLYSFSHTQKFPSNPQTTLSYAFSVYPPPPSPSPYPHFDYNLNEFQNPRPNQR